MKKTQNTTFGVHYMLDGYGASPDSLRNKEALLKKLKKLPGELGMHPISDAMVLEVGPNNKKDPGGCSGFVMIAESHISFHTFPNRGFVSIDVYTCNDYLDTDRLTSEFSDFFGIAETEVQLTKRGTKYPVEDIY